MLTWSCLVLMTQSLGFEKYLEEVHTVLKDHKVQQKASRVSIFRNSGYSW